MFLAEILSINVDESIVNRNGKIMLDKAELVSYLHGEYFELGRNLGKFGFSVNKKRANTRNNSDSTNRKSTSKKSPEKQSRALAANSGKSITPGSAKSKKQSKDKYSHLKNK